ncbi:hypothetical protein [Aeromonas salmonicida]|uniref:hypothetical protein n=1 Tax=Aeromonas salmonicida TaxID=645 RepID=UPI003D193DD0
MQYVHNTHVITAAEYPTLGGELVLTIRDKKYIFEGKDFGLEHGWIDNDDGRTDGRLLNDSNQNIQVMVDLRSPDSRKNPLEIYVTEIRHHKFGELNLSEVEIENNLNVVSLY